MNVLEVLYALMTHTNADALKNAKHTVLKVPEPEQWDKLLSDKLSLEKASINEESYFLILKVLKRGDAPKNGYLLLTIPVSLDVPITEEQTGVYLHPDPLRPIQVNPEYIVGEHQDFRPEIILSESEAALNNLSQYYEIGTPESWLSAAKSLLHTTCGVKSLAELLLLMEKQLNNTELSVQFSLASIPDTDGPLLHVSNLYKGLISDSASDWSDTPLKKLLEVFDGQTKTNPVSTGWLQAQTGWYSNPNGISHSPLMGHMDTGTGKLKLGSERELFPLDNTQRNASIMARHLDSYSKIDSDLGRLLAVSGPPGSGKTSMLKAIIAQESVLAVLNGKPCPIIVAAGATNQSVKNVVSAFPDVIDKTESDEFILYQRWLPSVNNYGSFLASSSALEKFSEEEKSQTPIINAFGKDKPYVFGWTSVCQDLNELSNLNQIEKYYLDKFSIHSCLPADDMPISLMVAKTHLKDYLTDLSTSMLTIAKECAQQVRNQNYQPDDLFPVVDERYYFQNFHDIRNELSSWLKMEKGSKNYLSIVARMNRERIRDENIIESEYAGKLHDVTIDLFIEHLLDTSYRPLMFHVAARYWEAEFLLSQRKSVLFAQTEENIIEGLRRICMVTPVIISTLHSLPKLLKINNYPPGSKQSAYAYGGIDLLITDESGQADIRLGLPSMSLCKRVISVGDINQLEPVIDSKKDISTYDDYTAWIKQGYSLDQITRFFELGFTPTSGSFLHLAISASSHSYQGDGFMLRGHYRCFQKIIDYCNQMVYDNKLFYLPSKNTEEDEEDFPAMAYVETPGSSETGGNLTSKQNKDEATLIAEMVVARYKGWQEKLKGKGELPKLPSILAIVTPFNQQPSVIRKALIKVNAEKGGIISDQEIIDTTIDTIHKLQGAEKDIVIFSGVQTHSDSGNLFFEKQPFLLNVAVSRAKKSFIAVICPKLYRLYDQPSIKDSPAAPANSVHFLGQYLNQYGKRLFPKHLFIVEAKGKVGALNQLLGQDYIVYPTNGSVTKSGLEEDNVPTAQRQLLPVYDLNKNGEAALKMILAEGSRVKSILLATDNDNVGETIAWHLYQHTKRIAPDIAKKMKRVPLSAINQSAVDEAKNHPREFDDGMVSAEIARDIIDKWVAQRMYSVIQNHTYLENKQKIGIGRVKAAVLDLLTKRQTIAEADAATSISVNLTVNGRVIKGSIKNMSKENVLKFKTILHEKERPTMNDSPDLYKFNEYNPGTAVSYMAPNRSTAGVLRYAYLKHNLEPKITMKLLQRLYTGEKTNE
jgi:hypothetical protein